MIRILLLLMAQVAWANDVVKELNDSWLVFQDGQYIPVTRVQPSTHTIYFYLNARTYQGQFLSIQGSASWTLFVNGQLIYSGSSHRFNIDSLARPYASPLFVGIHAPSGMEDLKTQVVAAGSVPETGFRDATLRGPSFFRDYSILAAAFILLFFLALLRTNPQLTIDYFSFGKIFSVQERNERLLASRITSSVNLLFYLFCALLTGFLLSAVFHFAGPSFGISGAVEGRSLGDAFAGWGRLSIYILLLLASKLLIVLIFSSLFNFRDTISFQFFNFLRFILFTAVTMAALSLGYFMLGGGQPIFYERLMMLALTLLSVGSVMVFVKLLARSPFSLFHLFSYLCASEIIPLVVIIKIFF